MTIVRILQSCNVSVHQTYATTKKSFQIIFYSTIFFFGTQDITWKKKSQIIIQFLAKFEYIYKIKLFCTVLKDEKKFLFENNTIKHKVPFLFVYHNYSFISITKISNNVPLQSRKDPRCFASV